MWRPARLGLILGAVCLPAVAMADDPDWIVTVGARVGVGPPYEGAPHDNLGVTGSVSIRRGDRPYRFTPPDQGIRFAVIAERHFDFGPVVRFHGGRGDTGRLQGFDKIGYAVEPGVYFDVWPTDWLRGRVEVRHGVTGHTGTVGDAEIDLVHTGARWDFSIGPRAGYGDRRYMDTYFGVTPLEAERSPFLNTPYDPHSGVRYAGAEAALAYHWTRRIRTTVDVSYHRLAETAADSPVVAIAGDRNQYFAGIGVTYSFGVNLHRHHQ
jgi:outer membrane scaffolding protein for murein synthesis (MipA/OmpV family)